MNTSETSTAATQIAPVDESEHAEVSPGAPRQPTHLAPHFDAPPRQFSSAKLGMWLFLGTEILFFGGLFVFYAVQRNLHPEIFDYGSRFLDWRMGGLNTVVLILSSVTMAIGVTAVQTNRRTRLIVCLALTFLGGAIFMGVKYVEYSHKFHENLVWGMTFYELPEHERVEAAASEEDSDQTAGETDAVSDAVRGRELFLATCRGCHGVRGEGIPGQGKQQQGSEFIMSKNDKDLVAFIKVGRMPWDPLNTTGIQMPPRGGNPTLTDHDLFDIVAYVRTFVGDTPTPAPAAADTGENATATTEATGAPSAGPNAGASAGSFYISRSSIPAAARGPEGLAQTSIRTVAAQHDWQGPHSEDPNLPERAHIYFGLYFAMTGLHGLHVLAGMGVMAWLLVRAIRGHFGSTYFTPVDLGGLYWHLVDLIWIFLFPLLYLI